MVEKRQSKRFKSNLLITTVYKDENDNLVTEDSIISEDIGAGGLRVTFPQQLPKGKVLDLKVYLFSDPIHLPAKGKVAWSTKKSGLGFSSSDISHGTKKELFWVGIQFVDIDAFTRERMLRWIRQEFKAEEL